MPRRTGKRSLVAGADGDSNTCSSTARLQRMIQDGETYEALQTARALFARLDGAPVSAANPGRKKGAEARVMVLHVARTLAEVGEYQSVLDLARLYMANNASLRKQAMPTGHTVPQVEEMSAEEAGTWSPSGDTKEAVEEGGEGDDPAWEAHRFHTGGRTAMLSLARLLPPASKERVALLKGLTRWAAEEEEAEEGGKEVLELGLELAKAYSARGEWARAAQQHGELARQCTGPDADTLAASYVQVLEAWSAEGYAGEKDLFLARAVLHGLGTSSYAVLGALPFARALMTAAQASSAFAPCLETSPLLHYVGLVVALLGARAGEGGREGGREGGKEGEVFQLLSSRYQPALRRDPALEKLVGRIGEGGFGLSPASNPMQAFLSSMLG
ncbi:hypothetical protein Naga_101019g2, partial [Nannochloropsis gaditana]